MVFSALHFLSSNNHHGFFFYLFQWNCFKSITSVHRRVFSKGTLTKLDTGANVKAFTNCCRLNHYFQQLPTERLAKLIFTCMRLLQSFHVIISLDQFIYLNLYKFVCTFITPRGLTLLILELCQKLIQLSIIFCITISIL